MSYEYLNKYDDFINTYDTLNHLQPNESIEEFFQQIETILIKKYKVSVNVIIRNLVNACKWNYRSIDSYIKILNLLFNKYSLTTAEVTKFLIETRFEGMKITSNNNEIFVFEKDTTDDELNIMIMYDQIDKIKEFFINISPEDIKINILSFSFDVLEACAYFGSINIFIYLISNFNYKISDKCLKYAVIGRNTDIINECLKNKKVDLDILKDAILSHNNDFIEDIIQKNLIRFGTFS